MSTFFLRSMLNRRARRGKEDPARLGERMGIAGRDRPKGPLIWFHAASVGESQSMLILINALLDRRPDISVLVTTGTVTSAQLMEKRLPRRTFHQFYPLDHPKWVGSFLDHWQPDLALWIESEIWPNMLKALKQREIPSALVNARLSPQSFKRWKFAAGEIRALLAVFSVCLAQTEEDAKYFRLLGAQNVKVADNLKYSAAPLPFEEKDLGALRAATKSRPLWLYASTHDGEEDMACRIHQHLQKKIPGLLTVIVPRHPERREEIMKICEKYSLKACLRTESKVLPATGDQIYVGDTLGELGLFYCLSPVACIGRSFSNDGGGGHNPIEAAQLGCAVLHGPNVQNLARIFEEFDNAGAAIRLKNEQDFQNRLERLFHDSDGLDALRNKATRFAQDKGKILEHMLEDIMPLLERTKEKRRSQCS